MEKLYQHLPEELVTFILVTVFSLLIGLSLRRISLKREGETTLFGTDRTFTFYRYSGLSPLYSRSGGLPAFYGRRSCLRAVACPELLRQAGAVSCVRGDYHCHSAHYVLHRAHCRHAAFMVLCHGDCNGIALYGVEAHLHRTGAADEE